MQQSGGHGGKLPVCALVIVSVWATEHRLVWARKVHGVVDRGTKGGYFRWRPFLEGHSLKLKANYSGFVFHSSLSSLKSVYSLSVSDVSSRSKTSISKYFSRDRLEDTVLLLIKTRSFDVHVRDRVLVIRSTNNAKDNKIMFFIA